MPTPTGNISFTSIPTRVLRGNQVTSFKGSSLRRIEDRGDMILDITALHISLVQKDIIEYLQNYRK